MNPRIQVHRPAKGKPFYMVDFEAHADRTRWLLRNDFLLVPNELYGARWTSWHNGSDYAHHLEMVPFLNEHSHNPLALYMKVYVHSNVQKLPPKKRPQQRGYEKSFDIHEEQP